LKETTTKTKKATKSVSKSAPKKAKKLLSDKGQAYITASFNNTLIAITDLSGAVLVNMSPGMIGFKGSRKSTAYAATKAAEEAAQRATKLGLREVKIFVKGLGLGRNGAIKGVRSGGLRINMITDKTPIPHGGPTPRKTPRGS